jgi:hypothetical protein
MLGLKWKESSLKFCKKQQVDLADLGILVRHCLIEGSDW